MHVIKMRVIHLKSTEGKSLVLVGKWLKLQEPEDEVIVIRNFWSTDVTKLKDGSPAILKEVFTGARGRALETTDFKTHRIGCCSFDDVNWDVIMRARKEYSK